MTFKELATKRFSVRKYTDEPISKADIEYIMDCVRLAPSAHNFQPWRFLVVTSEEGKEKVRKCYNRPWFANVPMFVLCFKSMNDAWVRTDDNKNHGDIDLGIAVEHLCLAAADCGLGSCWVCSFDFKATRQLFNLPPNIKPVALMPIGYAAPDGVASDRHPKRKPLSETVRYL